MVLRLHAFLAVGAEGHLGSGFQGFIGRSRFRVRPHRRHTHPGPSARNRRKRGTQKQAIGKSRGGLTTKIAALVDALGNLIRFVLLPGQQHDITSFDVLMAGVACLALIGDKAFDAHWLRQRLAGKGIESVIPLREGTTGHAPHDAEKYRWRHLVENFFCSLKAFRRIATRYEKTDKCFAAMINVVAVVLWTR
jgi:transposase